MSAASPPPPPPPHESRVIHRRDLPEPPPETRGAWHMGDDTARGATPHAPDRDHGRPSAPRGSGGAQWPELDDPTTRQPALDDCQRMGTLFGMINKGLRGAGFSQMYFGDKIVEPVVIMVFWMLLWFLGIQALGLVGTLCIIIIYIQD
ncbi:uncharacterized protein FAM241A [Eucyclogobius newberryi]|uniref:uncharacterized protein FAM241A n=1 Tax=Eucyclogobius newberryi TaxID=166745 RepID=UPI003B5CE6BE